MLGDYTANLCYRTATGEMVPYEQAPIQASDDRAATQEATQWIDHVRDLIDDGTWLVVEDGARGVYYKKIGAAIMPVRRKRPRDPAQLAKLMIDIASGEVTDGPPTKRTKTRKKRASARRGANLQRKTDPIDHRLYVGSGSDCRYSNVGCSLLKTRKISSAKAGSGLF
jgi:hypothetical protein